MVASHDKSLPYAALCVSALHGWRVLLERSVVPPSCDILDLGFHSCYTVSSLPHFSASPLSSVSKTFHVVSMPLRVSQLGSKLGI